MPLLALQWGCKMILVQYEENTRVDRDALISELESAIERLKSRDNVYIKLNQNYTINIDTACSYFAVEYNTVE